MNSKVYNFTEEEEEAIYVLNGVLKIVNSYENPDYVVTKCKSIREAIESETINEETLRYIANSSPREIIEEIESGRYDNI